MKSSRQEVADRRAELVALVQSGITHAQELADRLGVSAATVRRDLAVLDDLGRVVRTYGGARSTPFVELPLRVRAEKESAAKVAIAVQAAQFVPATGVIFIDAGSTCARLAELIEPSDDLTVVTRGLDVASSLAERGVDVVMLGGSVSALSQGTAGSYTETMLRSLRISASFLGVDAVDPIDGIGEPTIAEISVKRTVIERTENVYVLADHTKLYPSSVACWTRPEAWTLITDAAEGIDYEAYEHAGITLVTTERTAS